MYDVRTCSSERVQTEILTAIGQRVSIYEEWRTVFRNMIVLAILYGMGKMDG